MMSKASEAVVVCSIGRVSLVGVHDFFFFNDTATTEIYTLSLHDALPIFTEIYPEHVVLDGNHPLAGIALRLHLKVEGVREADRKSTRLNSSHSQISYAVFCLKKKN